MRLPLVPLALVFVLGACAEDVRVADTMFIDGHIYQDVHDTQTVEALLVRDGRVVRGGKFSELAPLTTSSGVTIVKLAGAFVVPGLQDAHGHVESYGASLENVDLRGVASFDEVIARVKNSAARLTAGTWIQGRGWDQNLWPDKAFPNHAALSAAVPNHPVCLSRIDGHAVLVNQRALELAHLDGVAASEDIVPGGRMLLDGEHRPTGVFIDNATDLFDSAIPEPDDATRERRLLLAQEHLLALGITAVHDMGVGPPTLRAMERLRAQGELHMRLVEYLSDAGEASESTWSDERIVNDPNDVLSVVGVKLYADGALGSRGAALLDPYSDDPKNVGLLLTTPETLAARIAVADKLGLQPAVHAIGDRANREVLDAYEAQMKVDPKFAALRPRIEHAQVVAPADWPRFAALGVIPSMQPTHATSDMPWAIDRLGAERIKGAYAWRRLAPDLSQLAFGSDFPVEDPDPLAGVYAAITRQDATGRPSDGFTPDQRLDARAALTAFTSGAAHAVHEEDRRGRLAPGYFADMTVLDIDPLSCEPRALVGGNHVLMTVIHGDVVYRKR
jgi:predicted amidohydrolase YtcJ